MSAGLRITNEAPADGWGFFADRRDAGRMLAGALAPYGGPRTVVVGLPRGGLPVADTLARVIGADLDVFVSRKIGVPGHRELAMGAVAEGGVVTWNQDVLRELALSQEECRRQLERARAELQARAAGYRAVLQPAQLAGRIVLLTDDGVATGATLRAAVAAIGHSRPARLVIALPGGARETLADLARLDGVHDVVAVIAPAGFYAVGQLYADFTQVDDREVLEILRQAAKRRAGFARSPCSAD